MKKGIYIKNKFRLLFIIAILVILNLGVTVTSLENKNNLMHNNSFEVNCNEEFLYVTVQNGDSIWSIVSANYDKINLSKHIDIRDVVSIVSDLNGGTLIKAGDLIKIPLNIK